MRTLLRSLYRTALYGGYSPKIKKFIDETRVQQTRPPYVKKGVYAVNFSFDLEMSYSTYFWQGKYELAKHMGNLAHSNLHPVTNLLIQNKIAHNVQVLSILLDSKAVSFPAFNQAQIELIKTQPHLFSLQPEDCALLENGYTQLGIHGYSHRLFTDLAEDDARDEIKRAQSIHQKFFPDHKKIFMSFPRNKVAHTNILNECGVGHWRSDIQFPITPEEFPIGHWFAPGNISPQNLKKILKHLRLHQDGFLLHLWGHYTEMNRETFADYLEIINDAGWTYTDTKSLVDKA